MAGVEMSRRDVDNDGRRVGVKGVAVATEDTSPFGRDDEVGRSGDKFLTKRGKEVRCP